MKQKIVIVGAGVLGCSLAHELTRAGALVTVLDAGEVGSGASAATFAWVNSNDKYPDEYSNLNLLGLQAHEHQTRTFSSRRWFHQTGNLQIARTGRQMALLEQKVLEHAARGIEARVISPSQMRRLEPSLQTSGMAGGAFFPREGWVDVPAMCTGLLSRAIEAGAAFLPHQTVTSVRNGGVTTTTHDGHRRDHAADIVLLAAGNGNRTILASADIPFPTTDPSSTSAASVGVIGTTGRTDCGITHIISGDGLLLRPARNGGIMFAEHPTPNNWDIHDPRLWRVPSQLFDRVREFYPCLSNVAIETVNLGIRVLPEDGLTIADWIGQEKSIYAVATHSGVTLAPYLAQAITEEVIHGRRHDALAAFGLSRFAPT
ncbi:NAD(P)/FAD-dependent oxidoreductase [Pseudarthrobacter oxydans]|uniref:NAD(P)/FAD-dependent oxidoreductase n=1 Tax=Pseudarthrobacter oxydans TaxID=1671 RepID=UPI00380B0D8B